MPKPASRWPRSRLTPRDQPMPARPKIGLTSCSSSWTARNRAKRSFNKSTLHTGPSHRTKLRGEDCGALDAQGARGSFDPNASYGECGVFNPIGVIANRPDLVLRLGFRLSR